MKEIIEKLRDDNHYYGEEGQKYLSNSKIGTLLNNPASFYDEQEDTLAMLRGRYFHTAMLEPEKLANFSVIDASTRSTKIYKEASEGELVLLLKEKEELDAMVNRMKGNFNMTSEIYVDGNLFEEPAVKELFGHLWKGKADIVTEDFVIDLKTTSDIQKFAYSARKYNYDSQAWLYQEFFGKPLKFFVIDSNTLQLGIFGCTEEFILNGKAKVQRAVEVYERFFLDSSTEDVNDYVIEGLL